MERGLVRTVKTVIKAAAVVAWIGIALYGSIYAFAHDWPDTGAEWGGAIVFAILWPVAVIGIPLTAWDNAQRKRRR